MDAGQRSETRSGRVYSPAAKIYVTSIICAPTFKLTPLLRRALDAELDALPDIPFDSARASEDILPDGLTQHERPVFPTQLAEAMPLPHQLPLEAFADGHHLGKRGTHTRGEQDDPVPLEKRPGITASACAAGSECSRPAKRLRAALGPPAPSTSSPTPHSSTSPPGVTTNSAKPKRPRTANRQARRAEFRSKKKDAGFVKAGQIPRPKDVERHVKPSIVVPVRLDYHNLPVNSGGYEALPRRNVPKAKLDVRELLDAGFTKVEWDGRETKVIEHPETKRLFGFCVGRIEDPTFDASCQEVAALLVKAGLKTTFTEKQSVHKRGDDFAAINAGMFAGHGPPEPYNLLNTQHQELVDELLENEHVQRLATFQSSSLALYLPRLYEKYHATHTSVVERCSYLRPNFKRSVFSTAAFNFGPQVCTIQHIDCMNLANGQCAVHALGDYDYTKGGHLVLVEARLIIEFPPGSLILIPSAVVTHANTPVQEGEIRVSFTQYTPGALFRYVENGFRTLAKFREEDEEGYDAMMAKRSSRWKEGLELWPTFDELVSRQLSK